MEYNFDEVIDRSRNRAAKYDERMKKFGRQDVIPLWVADMDFRTAQPIIDALKEKAEQGFSDIPPDRILILSPYGAGRKGAMDGKSGLSS